MARCGCSGSTCSCLVVGGAGVAVSGTGTEANPYVIDVVGSDIAGTFRVQDTATVDLTLTGSGSTADPYTLSADSALALTQLSDITSGDVPAAGDVPVWNGSTWDFAPPPTTPPGAVNVGAGLTGDGSGGAPLQVATSGTWGVAPLDTFGTNTLLGAPTYIDTNGQVRAQPRGIDVIATPAARPNQYPGRVYVRSDTNDFAWSNGTAWQPFAVASPEMIPVPRYRARLGASTVVANTTGGSPTWLAFSSQYTAAWSTPMGHLEFATVAGVPVIRALIAGYYEVEVQISWAGTSATAPVNGTRGLGVWRIDDEVPFASDARSGSITGWSGGPDPQSMGLSNRISTTAFLDVGEYLRFGAINLSSASRSVVNTGRSETQSGGYADSYVSVRKVGSYTRGVFSP